MRALGAMVIIAGFVCVWAFYALFWVGYQAKRLSNKQGRKEIKDEVTDNITFLAKDKDFHKAFKQEFRWHYILFALIIISLIGTAFGLDDW